MNEFPVTAVSDNGKETLATFGGAAAESGCSRISRTAAPTAKRVSCGSATAIAANCALLRPAEATVVTAWRRRLGVEPMWALFHRVAGHNSARPLGRPHATGLGEVVDLVSRELKPHHLCTYLYELAARFSAFYENCPVIQSEEPTRASRLALCDLTARTMALGLDLLGIEHPDQM